MTKETFDKAQLLLERKSYTTKAIEILKQESFKIGHYLTFEGDINERLKKCLALELEKIIREIDEEFEKL